MDYSTFEVFINDGRYVFSSRILSGSESLRFIGLMQHQGDKDGSLRNVFFEFIVVNFMALLMKQNQQQRQKLTQEQSFFLDILKFDKEELTDYLEKEYQENPLIDFDRRAFNNEGSSFEGYLSNIENKAEKRIVTGTFIKTKRVSCSKSTREY